MLFDVKHKIDYAFGSVVLVLSTVFGDFWFLFAFLLILNIFDYITGIMKAKYLGIESSKMGLKGMCKKVFIWVLVAISFGISLIFVEIGEKLDVNIGFMTLLGWLMLAHAIINEFRSIIENIVACDKDHLVPMWLIKGLEVTERVIHNKADGNDLTLTPVQEENNIKKDKNKE